MSVMYIGQEKLDGQTDGWTDRQTDAGGYSNTPSAKYGRGIQIGEKIIYLLTIAFLFLPQKSLGGDKTVGTRYLSIF